MKTAAIFLFGCLIGAAVTIIVAWTFEAEKTHNKNVKPRGKEWFKGGLCGSCKKTYRSAWGVDFICPDCGGSVCTHGVKYTENGELIAKEHY